MLAEPFESAAVLRGTFRLIAESAGPMLAVVLLVGLPWVLFAEWAGLGEAEFLEYLRASAVYDATVGVFGSAAITVIAFGSVEGERPSIGEALSRALRAWGPLILATLLSGVIVLVFLVLLVVPGILRALSYAALAPVVVLERTGGRRFDPLGRSTQLMYGHRKPAFIALFLLTLLSGVPALLLALFGAQEESVRVAGGLATSLFHLPLDVVSVVFYVKAKRSHDALMKSVRDEPEK